MKTLYMNFRSLGISPYSFPFVPEVIHIFSDFRCSTPPVFPPVQLFHFPIILIFFTDMSGNTNFVIQSTFN